MSDVLNSEALIIVINKFLCCVPVKDIELKDCLSSISWDDQKVLLDRTVNSDLVKKHPIKASYQKAFLKSVIQILEKNTVDIHDDLYDTYCDILSLDDTDKYYYKHYKIGEVVVTLKENKNFISEGTTGLCSWQASLALSQWCLDNKTNLHQKTILELGSGVGLVGLIIAKHCQPKHIYLTDCHPEVLSVLSENVLLNSRGSFDSFANIKSVSSEEVLPTAVGTTIKLDSTEVSVVNLPWESVTERRSDLVPDLIIAADVVYDNSVFESLCGAVKYFLDNNPKAEVVFACTERNSETLQEFLSVLGANNLKTTTIETPEPKNIYWSGAVPIHFYLISS